MIGTPTIFFDCDDTLVMWNLEQSPRAVKFHCYGNDYLLVPHEKHIENLKLHKQEGYKIVVWSAGGEEWGREVVEKLGLTSYVDAILSKPSWYYDDLTADKFMHRHRRVYYKQNNETEYPYDLPGKDEDDPSKVNT